MAGDDVWVESRLCLAILGELRTSIGTGAPVSAAAVGLAGCDEVLALLAALADGSAASAGEAVDAMADDATWVVIEALAADRW